MRTAEGTKIADIFENYGDISEVIVGLGMKGSESSPQ